jgi:hypothetical protein
VRTDYSCVLCFANIPTVCESPPKVPIADRIRLAFDDARTDRHRGHATVSRGQWLPSVQYESKESTLRVPTVSRQHASRPRRGPAAPSRVSALAMVLLSKTKTFRSDRGRPITSRAVPRRERVGRLN